MKSRRPWKLIVALSLGQMLCVGVAFVAVHRLTFLGAEMLSADDREVAEMYIERALQPLATLAIGVTGISTLMGLGLTMALVRGFDRKVSAATDELGKEVEQRTREVIKTREAVIFALAKVAELRSHETGKHLERVQEYSVILCQRLMTLRSEINANYIETLKRASWLHDIGKVAIPDHLLVKAAPLSNAEKDIIKAHAILGARCLAAIRQQLGDDDFLGMAHDVVLSHHERWDGTGYPHGLAGEAIPLSARIVAVADVYDALTSDRIYHAAAPHAEAREIIRQGAGTQFDPMVVAAFLEAESLFQQTAQRLKDSADVSEELRLLGEIRELVQAVANRQPTETPNWLTHLLSSRQTTLATSN